MKNIRSIKKLNIVDEVYNQMKELIISEDWETGSKIPSEHELARSFNVSRNTVRSAIQKLSVMGVLSTRQGQGTFVCDTVFKAIIDSIVPVEFLSNEEIMEIIEFRKPLEIESAGLAAIRHNDDDICMLKEALNEMMKNIGDYKSYSNWDYQFHLIIARASGNRIIYSVLIKLRDIIYTHFEKMAKDLGTELSIENHKKIFEAIRSRDAVLAGQLMKENIELSINVLKKESLN